MMEIIRCSPCVLRVIFQSFLQNKAGIANLISSHEKVALPFFSFYVWKILTLSIYCKLTAQSKDKRLTDMHVKDVLSLPAVRLSNSVIDL